MIEFSCLASLRLPLTCAVVADFASPPVLEIVGGSGRSTLKVVRGNGKKLHADFHWNHDDWQTFVTSNCQLIIPAGEMRRGNVSFGDFGDVSVFNWFSLRGFENSVQQLRRCVHDNAEASDQG